MTSNIRRYQVFTSFLALLICCVCILQTNLRAEPRTPQPPWPQPTLRIYGFDGDYWRGLWCKTSLFEDQAELAESWSGYSLVRDGFVTSPVVIPFETENQRPSVAVNTGAVRFWISTSWSTASTNSGGSGPGRWARLLELVNVSSESPDVKWSLFLNEAGDTVYLGGAGLGGAQEVLKASVEFTAGDWRMITLCYSPTNTELQIDNQVVATGAGLPQLLWWETNALGLVIGSDVLASPDSLAGAQFEEVTTFARWPQKSDWQELYYQSAKRRSLLGPVETEQLELTKTMLLKSAGLVSESYGEALSELEGGGPMESYIYAPGSLWLEITGVSNNLAYLTVHGTVADAAYEILSKESLTNTEWTGEQVILGAEGQDWTPTTVTVGARTNNLFFWARTLVDTDGDGLPDWWELAHGLDPNNSDTGNTGVTDGYKDDDNDGWANLQEYQNGTSPGAFDTPAAPQGLLVRTDSTGTHAKLSWLPASSAVTGYTIQRSDPSGLTQVSSSTVSHVDTQAALPTGLYWDFEIPTYRLRAEYANGSSEWSEWKGVFDLIAPRSTVVSGSGASAQVFVADIPNWAAFVRVGDAAFVNPTGNYSAHAADIPVSQFTNGLAALPPSLVRFRATISYMTTGLETPIVA